MQGGMAIDQNGKIWAWGYNNYKRFGQSFESEYVKTPTLLKGLNEIENRRAVKVKLGEHMSIIVFEDDKGNSYVYTAGEGYSSDEYAKQTGTTYEASKRILFREMEQFRGRKVIDMGVSMHHMNHFILGEK